MGYLNEEQMKDGSQSSTVEAGETARVVLTAYEPFQSKKGNTIPKHLGYDNDTLAGYEFVGFKFHEAVKEINDSITPGETVIEVQCLDNSTAYPDYAITVTTDKAKPNPVQPVEGIGKDGLVTPDSVPF